MNTLKWKRKRIDIKTLGLFFLCIFLQLVSFYLAQTSVWGIFLAVILGTIAMNITFTVWHEASHQIFSNQPTLNHIMGFAGSQLTLYPGYFSRRREHLAHHRWEGDPKLDPVYPRIQGSLPQMLPLTIGSMKTYRIPSEYMPLSKSQKISDWILILISILLAATAFYAGYFAAFFFSLVLPRAIVWLLHAWYVCYLPHSIPQGGYERYRIVSESFLARFFTIEQSLHGVHHRIPSLPWHQYYSYLKNRGDSWHE